MCQYPPMFINRTYIKTILAGLPQPEDRTEKALAARQGITYPTYWRRCKRGIWKQEQLQGLAATLSDISGRNVEVWDIAVCGKCGRNLYNPTGTIVVHCPRCEVPL